MPNVHTRDLIKVYRAGKSEVIALRGLEMKLSDGELVAVQGPSGCGKTTLLNLVGGIDRPTAGRVEVDGTNIVDYGEGELVRYRRDQVGFVFQFFNLVPTLTAVENVELPMRLAGKSATHRQARTKQLLQLVDLEARAGHRPDELSGGEQQRIAIAVSLSNDPSLILADEPTGELDTENGQRVLDLFEVLNKDLGKTVLVVTHDQRVSKISRRMLQIEDGVIINEVIPT